MAGLKKARRAKAKAAKQKFGTYQDRSMTAQDKALPGVNPYVMTSDAMAGKK